VAGDSAVSAISETTSQRGIAPTYAAWTSAGGDRLSFFQEVLLDGIRLLGPGAADADIVLSGMASANIGLLELPYKELPVRADGSDLLCSRLEASTAFPHRLLLVSGVRSSRDVMRGEETQLAGCPAVQGAHRFIFPGTHSKHILVRGPLAVDCQTYMTGELFALLARHSLIAKSVVENTTAHPDAFAQGVADGAEGNLLQRAFLVRTNQLFNRLTPQQNYHYLSGLLIGSEFKTLLENDIPLTVIGNALQNSQYATAASILGLAGVRTLDSATISIRGQRIIWRHRIGKES
jgi:2-dehydro-3-deoxygalactonokinase